MAKSAGLGLGLEKAQRRGRYRYRYGKVVVEILYCTVQCSRRRPHLAIELLMDGWMKSQVEVVTSRLMTVFPFLLLLPSSSSLIFHVTSYCVISQA